MVEDNRQPRTADGPQPSQPRMAIRSIHLFGQHSLNTVTTNVPGPQFPLYCLGHEILEYRPFVPISHGLHVGTAILSYRGKLFFGVTGDYDCAPTSAFLPPRFRSTLQNSTTELSPGSPAHVQAEQTEMAD